MFDFPYLIELLTPKKTFSENDKEPMDRFAERYLRILNSKCGMSIPNNPMGQLRYNAVEAIDLCGLSVDSRKTVMNLNTFHSKESLDLILISAAHMGIEYLLVVRGDGGPDLEKLSPESIGGQKNVATTMDLITYINKSYPGTFTTGVAFNQYNPVDFETNRLKQKIDAGARFVITQPVIGKDPNVDLLADYDIPIVIEAWMSTNVDLLYKSVQKEKDENLEKFDPIKNLKTLHKAYPENCVYLSMLSFQQKWKDILPRM